MLVLELGLRLGVGSGIGLRLEMPRVRNAWIRKGWGYEVYESPLQNQLQYSSSSSSSSCILCIKKVPIFKLSVTLSNLNRFSNFVHCWKAYEMKFATKSIRHYPSHQRHVATLPWEIKNSNFHCYFSFLSYFTVCFCMCVYSLLECVRLTCS